MAVRARNLPISMLDLFREALGFEGFAWIFATILLAGIVYGFAGFGSALIFMPVAIRFIPVELAIGAFSLGAFASLVTVVPKALPLIDKRAVKILIVTAALGAVVGIYVLKTADLTVLRWAVIAVTSVTLAALVSGWRYETQPTPVWRGAIGAATGVVGGATGLLGPVMVLFQLASRDSVARGRATTAVFLTSTTLLMLPIMAMQGILPVNALVLGLVLLPPYGVGCWIGARLFRPDYESLYRALAYVMIGTAILIGLPVWD